MSSFNLYGVVAVVAADGKNKKSNPSESWDEACKDFFEFISSKEKQCPKNAFLGLCEAGFVKGYPRGKYFKTNRVNKNKEYAIEAVSYLRKYPKVTMASKNKIWEAVLKKLSLDKKKHNSQMDVVIALYLNNLLMI